jgi:hypothetical protein
MRTTKPRQIHTTKPLPLPFPPIFSLPCDLSIIVPKKKNIVNGGQATTFYFQKNENYILKFQQI